MNSWTDQADPKSRILTIISPFATLAAADLHSLISVAAERALVPSKA
jgi:hypothetical protein